MKKYEDVSAWRVIDEIEKGIPIYIIDKSQIGNELAIRNLCLLPLSEAIALINCENENKRYSFFKFVENEERI